MSRALWIPTIWFLYTASKPLAVWFPASGATPESSPLDRAFLVGLTFLALMVLTRRKFIWAAALKDNALLVILLSFMLVSVLWSSIPQTSFNRWIREAQAVVMAFVVFTERSPRCAIESVLRRSSYILIPFSALLVKYYSIYGIEYGRWTGERMWIGVSTQKNGLGLLCLITIFFISWSMVRRHRKQRLPAWRFEAHVEIIVIGLSLWLMRGPGGSFFYSATSFITLIIGLLLLFGFRFAEKSGRKILARALMTSVAVILLTGVITLFTGGSNIKIIAAGAGRDSTLTGRADVWASLLPVVKSNLFLGAGFGGFWTPRTKEAFRISGAHSGYLDVLLGLGVAGLLLTFAFFMDSCKKALKTMVSDYHWGVLWTTLLIMVIIHNITESSMHAFASYMMAIVLFLTVGSSHITSPSQSIQ